MSDIGFYDSRAWRRARRERRCGTATTSASSAKKKHIHVRAELVHHVYRLADYPQWGLLEFVRDPVTGEERRNLLPVCRECHETVCHPERLRASAPRPPLTVERW